MSHHITYHPTTHIIETQTQGLITLVELKQIFAEGLQVGVEKGHFLFLTDFRAATLHLSTWDIYNAPRLLAQTARPQGLDARTFKCALVVNEKFQDVQFAETVSVNQGQRTKFFYDLEKARRWLINKYTLL